MGKNGVLLIALILLSCHLSFGQQYDNRFSQNQILDDLDYLYNSLIDNHHTIYAYVSEKDFKRNYTEVSNSVNKDSFTILEAINVFQKVVSAANNGHTEIDFPIDSYRIYAHNNGTLFPLEIAFENNKKLVRKNFSTISNIEEGSEIISINGQSIDFILSKIYPQVSAERKYLKNAKIEMYSFPRYYWQVYGRQDTFEVEIESDGIVDEYNLSAVHLIEGFETPRKEILNAQMKVKFFDQTAYLNPGNFSGDEEIYQHFIDSAFFEINNSKSQNLIIDLRNNAGGNNSFSDYLVSHIADKAFLWTSNFTLKTSQILKDYTIKNRDTTLHFFEEILRHNNGEIYTFNFEKCQPQSIEKRFKGKVYVLVNRQSHSQSAVTAAQIQDYDFGTIVGEESGDFPSLYASQFQYALPQTGIPVKVSKGRIIRVNGSTKEEGVIPDILIKDHLLDEHDEILDGLLSRLKSSKI